jgi:glucose-1-phosphate thymidylyltransferase
VQEVIGLLPAAGQATRIAPLPFSKELYPVGFRFVDEGRSIRPKVVCHYLLEKMRLAGIAKSYILLRSGKWDIPAYLGDGAMLNMHLGYLIMGLPFGVPYTLDQAYPFVQEALVVLGFPDILFQPNNAFIKLLARQAARKVDVVLGLFPTDQTHKAGMVDFDTEGRVRLVVEKPLQTELQYMWGIAVWTPVFTHFMHQYLTAIEADRLRTDPNNSLLQQRELPIGDVFQAAIESGIGIEAEVFADGTYLDIGTPEDLVRAVRDFAAKGLEIG